MTRAQRRKLKIDGADHIAVAAENIERLFSDVSDVVDVVKRYRLLIELLDDLIGADRREGESLVAKLRQEDD